MTNDLPKLDLSWVESPDHGVAMTLKGVPDKYLELSKKFHPTIGWTKEQYVFRFFISRLSAVHLAISREIKHSNPHAVFPLLRVYFETLVVLLYCTKVKSYIYALFGDQDPANPILSMNVLFDKLEEESGSLATIYHDYSRVTHPKEDAVLSVYPEAELSMDGTQIRKWQFDSFWRTDEDFKGACSAIIEMSEIAYLYLEIYGTEYLA